MEDELVDRLWEAVAERVGDDLRGVVRYAPTEFEVRLRDDVRDRYGSEDRVAVVDDTIVNQLSLANAESAYKAGRVEGFVRVFEEAWVLAWPDGSPGKSGVLVSIERTGSTASMDDVEWCLRYLDREIRPRLE